MSFIPHRCSEHDKCSLRAGQHLMFSILHYCLEGSAAPGQLCSSGLDSAASYLCSGRWNSKVSTIIIHKERLYNDSNCPYPARTSLWSGRWIVFCKLVTFSVGPGIYTQVIVSWMSTQSPFFPPSIRSFSFWTFGQLLFMAWLAFRAQKGVFCRIENRASRSESCSLAADQQLGSRETQQLMCPWCNPGIKWVSTSAAAARQSSFGYYLLSSTACGCMCMIPKQRRGKVISASTVGSYKLSSPGRE